MPDLEAEVASLLAELLRVVTSAAAVSMLPESEKCDRKWLTFAISIMVNPREPNVHETAVPRGQEEAQARECGCDKVAVHFELGHDFWQAVGEGEIVDLNVGQGDQPRNRDGCDEKTQGESGDDERLGLGCHVQVPDEVDGHPSDDDICQDAHDTCCDPACEYWCEVLSVMVQPWLRSVRTCGHTDEGHHAECRYQGAESPAETRFV